MSTSLLYQGFGVRGYRHVRTEYSEGEVVFTVKQPREALRCSACGSADVMAHGGEPRLFRTLPIGAKPVRVFLQVPRVECRRCGLVRQVKIGFAEPRRHYTRSFERYALELCRRMTIQDVANHLQVSWDVIKDIQKRHLQRRYARRRLRHVRQIAIDEIHVGKGHRYVTVVLDLQSGAVVFVGNGKGADALQPFWRQLKAARARIQAVASDLAPAYLLAIRENLPQAVHVFDRFHVIKLYNDKLSEFRRQLYHELTDKMHQQILKGTRWLLLKNPENLDDRYHERRRLEEALAINKPLATVYYMKDELRQFWEQPSKAVAADYLRSWIRRAEQSGIAMLQRFATTLALHRSGLLAWHDHPISTGPLEGTNNKIQTMKRQAYGFRDQEFFKLRIYHLHQTKYALVG